MDARSPFPPSRPRATKRRGLGSLSLLGLTLVVVAVAYVGLTPWILHIGGRSTPLAQWDGYGRLVASNGGKYVLYTHLQGGMEAGSNSTRTAACSFVSGCNTLRGTAQLCTESGVTRTFALSGTLAGWWTTDGAQTRIRLTGGAPAKLPPGWVVALHGVWHGPQLELASPDSSFTEVFTPRGEIRQTTSTADAGTAAVTLRYGSKADFEAACRALKG